MSGTVTSLVRDMLTTTVSVEVDHQTRQKLSDSIDTHSRGYDYASARSRPQHGHSYGSRQSRAPVDPHTLDYPASLKQFAEWFRYYYPQQASEEDIADKAAEQEAADGSKPRNGIKSRWEKYKKDFLGTQVSAWNDGSQSSLSINYSCNFVLLPYVASNALRPPPQVTVVRGEVRSGARAHESTHPCPESWVARSNRPLRARA